MTKPKTTAAVDTPSSSQPHQLETVPSGIRSQSSHGFETREHETGQASLFPSQELIIPDSVLKLRKAVAAIHACPVKPEHAQSLNSRRLFDACIIVAQLDMRSRGDGEIARVKSERLSPVFETRIGDLAQLAMIPGKNYQRIYEELDMLFEMVLRWNIIGEGSSVEWEMKSHFLSSIGYGKGSKEGLVRFSIDPSVLEIILEPSRWATLSLQAMEGLRTSASYALYQNCWRYVTTHQRITAALPTLVWVELLVGPGVYLDEDPINGEKVVRYGDFKRRVLTEAIERVNSNPALSYTLELKEHKRGRRVTKLQFKFVPKEIPSLGIPLYWEREILDVLHAIGFSDQEIADMSQAKSMEEVAETIVRMKEAEARLRVAGKRITSRKAYFSGILTNVSSDADWEAIEIEKLEQETNIQEAQQRADERRNRLKEEFAEYTFNVFVRNLFALTEVERKYLMDGFEASKEGRAAEIFVNKGWTTKNRPLLAILRKWIAENQPDLYRSLHPHPQDHEYDAWLAWRLEEATANHAPSGVQ